MLKKYLSHLDDKKDLEMRKRKGRVAPPPLSVIDLWHQGTNAMNQRLAMDWYSLPLG